MFGIENGSGTAMREFQTQDTNNIKSYLKNVFWPNLGVGPSLQVLEILEYVCGLKLGPALILNQNPIFEMASNKNAGFIYIWPESANPTRARIDRCRYP